MAEIKPKWKQTMMGQVPYLSLELDDGTILEERLKFSITELITVFSSDEIARRTFDSIIGEHNG